MLSDKPLHSSCLLVLATSAGRPLSTRIVPTEEKMRVVNAQPTAIVDCMDVQCAAAVFMSAEACAWYSDVAHEQEMKAGL